MSWLLRFYSILGEYGVYSSYSQINLLAYLTDILTRVAEEGARVDYSAMMANV